MSISYWVRDIVPVILAVASEEDGFLCTYNTTLIFVSHCKIYHLNRCHPTKMCTMLAPAVDLSQIVSSEHLWELLTFSRPVFEVEGAEELLEA